MWMEVLVFNSFSLRFKILKYTVFVTRRKNLRVKHAREHHVHVAD